MRRTPAPKLTPEQQAVIDRYREALRCQQIDFRKIDKFLDHLTRHPKYWKAFQKRTFLEIEKGEKKGAKGINEDVRAYEGVGKIANEFVSYYARLFAIKYPQHRDYFEFKEVRGLAA